jgi:hypothetical protein
MDKHNTTTQPSITDSRAWRNSARTITRHNLQRWTHHTKQTLTRIVMDEVEFHKGYHQALDAAEKIGAPDTKRAVMLMLQLMQGMFEMIQDLQLDEDDDE